MTCMFLLLQEELLDILLDIPIRMMDKKLSLLAGKILLYFAENPQVSSPVFNYNRKSY